MQELRYNPQYHDDWAWSLAIKGATNKDIADAFGISMRTVIRWSQTYESFRQALEAGKIIADSKVEKSLFKKATGFELTDTEEIFSVDEDGEQKIARVKKTTKSVAPDTMAIMYWLNNRQKTTWSQKQEVEIKTDNQKEDIIIYLPANGRDDEEENTQEE